ncbi:hypothetical protein FNL55_16075 [Tardiphaga sp. vice352]|uniref:hypothetical protein n=1 Tax=Tardiphaga sp. vice352 TaxID=2592816 RepID=UPI0011653DB8|nr:hypothetical protein [Tardiphaga sp. vice352]QDM32697.1 hypothetical protein FNL55_16075 [Tardiphaga sp. vice352]
MKNVYLVCCAALVLSGCAVREANLRRFEDQRPLTPQQRAMMVSEVRAKFFDPYSIRDAQISNASPGADMNMNISYTVCVRANAKNPMGAYTGRTATMYHLTGDGQISKAEEDAWGFCDLAQLRYEPFPEIENLEAKPVGSRANERATVSPPKS